MEPFGAPRGTVRAAIVGLLILAAVILGLWGSEAAYTPVVALLGGAIRDYFAHREAENLRAGGVLPEPEEG